MTITAAGLAAGTPGDNTTSVSHSVGSVTAGQLIVVCGMKFSPSDDDFVAADCTKSAGTATIGTVDLDRQDGGLTGGASYAHTAVWSAIVTGSGTLTMQIAGAAAGSYLLIGVEAFNGSWDATRAEAANGALDTGDAITSMSTGNATSAGAALFVAALSVNDNQVQNIVADAAFTVIYEDDTNSHALGSSIYRIVSSGTTDAGDWTFTTLNAGPDGGASASLVVYKEAAGAAAASKLSLLGVG